MTTAHDFSRNRVVGWSSLAVGVAVGLVMGLWSFDGPMRPPEWLGDYADTSRRLARLGHIAFIGLGLIDILIERELDRSTLQPAARAVASWAMVIGNVFLPLTLFAAAAYRPLKYGMAIPATSVFVALLLAAYGARLRSASFGGASPSASFGGAGFSDAIGKERR
jgi:hypothetical protein